MNKDEVLKMLNEIIGDYEDGYIVNPNPSAQANRNKREVQLKKIRIWIHNQTERKQDE